MKMQAYDNIHLVHFYSTPGGIEVLLSRILNSFSSFVFRVFIIRPPVTGEIDVYDESEVIKSYGSRSNLRAVLKLWRYARRNRNDIFHAFNLGPFFLIMLHLAGVDKIIYSIHGTNYWNNRWQRSIRKQLWNLILKKQQIITANSEYSKQVFHEKINADTDIKLLYNPIGGRNFYPKENRIRSSLLRIIYVGRLNKDKNLEKWIDLAYALHSDLPDTEFEIYGSGPLDVALKLRIERLHAGNYIFLKGFRRDIENIYREADLLLFLSAHESFGNVVVESILCGTPVIASDIPSMREIFCDFPEFLVSSDGDLQQEVYERLLNYDMLCNLATEALRSFRARFSEESYINSLDTIYHSLNDRLL
jgi:glycosyltransferase involved in cell wall biosynthesis